MSRPPLIRQGEGTAGLHRIQHELAQTQARLERLHRQPTDHLDSNRVTRATAPGDTRKLRGIPAIGRNVAGHIPGTNPGHA